MVEFDNIYKDHHDFNMDVLFLTRLDRRLEECNTARNQGLILTWYRALTTVYSMIHFKVKEAGNEKEELELEKQFKEIKVLLMEKNLGTENNTRQLSIIENKLYDIQQLLDDLLHAYGLIMKNKEKRNPREAVKEVFRHG